MRILNLLNYNTFFNNNNLRLYFFLLLLVYIPYFFYNIISLYIRPDILLITVFYFSIRKTFHVNLFYIILIGLLNDGLNNEVLGTQSLIYLMVSLMGRANSNALFRQKFSIVFGAFIVVNIITFLLNYGICYLAAGHTFGIYNNLFDFAATILLYPALHYFYTVKLKWFINHNER